jgi:hypothetical protein
VSTRSLIARQNRDGSFDAVTVHFGHPNSVGPTLVKQYGDEAKIAALLALGPLSCLEAEIGEKQDFNQPHPGWCLAFARDRGDDPVPPIHCETLADLGQRARRLFIGHVFVWTTNPQTGQKAWAALRMPEETPESVQTIVGELREAMEGKRPAPLGLDARSDSGGAEGADE